MTQAQSDLLKTDTSIAIPKVAFDKNGNILMQASPTSSNKDFDFLIGKWNLHHRKLKSRLTHSNEWEEFDNTVDDMAILSGTGNMDIVHQQINGSPWEGRTLRLFNPKTKLWSLYWFTSATGTLDPPVVGSFENNVGQFLGRDVYNGKDVIILFRWDARDKEHLIWSQAFSADKGKTWEWNWYNVSTRAK